MVTAVGPRGEEWGRLIVPRAPVDAGRTGMVLERAAAALALNRMIERDRSGLHQQAQSGLIDDVLRELVTDERGNRSPRRCSGPSQGGEVFPDRGARVDSPVTPSIPSPTNAATSRFWTRWFTR